MCDDDKDDVIDIVVLKDQDGTWVESDVEIKDIDVDTKADVSFMYKGDVPDGFHVESLKKTLTFVTLGGKISVNQYVEIPCQRGDFMNRMVRFHLTDHKLNILGKIDHALFGIKTIIPLRAHPMLKPILYDSKALHSDLAIYHDDANKFVKQIANEVNDNEKAEGKLKGFKYVLKLDTPKTQIATQVIKMNPRMQTAFEEHVDELIKLDEIERLPDDTIGVRVYHLGVEQSNKTRFCTDARPINEKLISDENPSSIPDVTTLFKGKRGYKYYTKLDITRAYNAIEFEEADDGRVFFTHRGKKVGFKRCPFGISDIPSFFNRAMRQILAAHEDYCDSYFDDVMVFSDDYEEHLKHVKAVLISLTKAGLRINASKCEFCCEAVPYLGYYITQDGILPQQKKINELMVIKDPKTYKQCESLLGKLGYNRNFFLNATGITSELRLFMKQVKEAKENGKKVDWTPIAGIVQRIRDELQKIMKISFITPGMPIKLYTDASMVGIGALLTQEVNGKTNIIGTFSRSLNKHEKNYNVNRKEMLAVIDAVRYFSDILRWRDFVVVTDNQTTKAMLDLKKSTDNRTLNEWNGLMMFYDYDMEKIKGEYNWFADLFSRTPYGSSDEGTIFEPVSDHNAHVKDNELLSIDYDAYYERKSVVKVLYTTLRSGRKVGVTDDEDDDGRITPKPTSDVMMNDEVVTEVTKTVVSNATGDDVTQDNVEIDDDDGENNADDKRENTGVLEIKNGLDEIMEDRRQMMNFIRERHEFHHGSANILLEEVKEKFGTNVGLSYFCRTVTDECETCMHTNTHKSGHMPTQHIVAEEPWQIVSADLLELAHDTYHAQLQKEDRFGYALVLVDHMTSFVVIKPIKTKSKEDVIEAMNWAFANYGSPALLRSDGGGELNNSQIDELVQKAKIQHRKSAAYNSKSVGKVERHNRSIRDLIRKLMLIDKYRHDWSTYAYYIQYLLNSRISPIAKYSPFYMMFGRHPWGQFTDYIEAKVIVDAVSWANTRKLHAELLKKIDEDRVEYYEKMKKDADKGKAMTGKYPQNTHVMVKNFGGDKSIRPYIGPFIVIGHDVYGNHILKTFGGKGARIWTRRPPVTHIKPVVKGEDVETIGSIVDYKEVNGEECYYVKFLGIDDVHEVTKENMLDQHLMKVYHEKRTKFYSNPRNAHKDFVYEVDGRIIKKKDLLIDNEETLKKLMEPPQLSKVMKDKNVINLDK